MAVAKDCCNLPEWARTHTEANNHIGASHTKQTSHLSNSIFVIRSFSFSSVVWGCIVERAHWWIRLWIAQAFMAFSIATRGRSSAPSIECTFWSKPAGWSEMLFLHYSAFSTTFASCFLFSVLTPSSCLPKLHTLVVFATCISLSVCFFATVWAHSLSFSFLSIFAVFLSSLSYSILSVLHSFISSFAVFLMQEISPKKKFANRSYNSPCKKQNSQLNANAI